MIVIPTIRNWSFEELTQTVSRLSGLGLKIYRVNLKSYDHKGQFTELVTALLSVIDKYPDIQIMFDVDFPNDSPRITLRDSSHYSFSCGENITLVTGDPVPQNSMLPRKSLWIKSIHRINAKSFVYKDGNAVFDIYGEISPNIYTGICKNACTVWSGRAAHFIPQHLVSGNNLSNEQYVINSIPAKNIYGVALSFSHNTSDIENAKMLFGHQKFICKIEDISGVENILQLAAHPLVYAIYIGRGDLLLSAREKYSKIMKSLLAIRKEITVKLFIGTDILESLKEQVVPSPSDISDLEIIYDFSPNGVVVSPGVSYSKNFSDLLGQHCWYF